MGLKKTGIIVFVYIFPTLAQDIVPDVACNMENKTWTDAWNDCLKISGKLVPYETGIGVNIDSINLAKESDVWTADYALQQSGSGSSTKLCGFNYFSTTILSSQIFYGDCHRVWNYFCKNKTKLYIMNSTYDNILCNDVILKVELLNFAHFIIPGFYWTGNTAYVKTDTSTSLASAQTPFLCGAFSAATGKYFVDCTTKRSSLCYIGTRPQVNFDRSCFANRNRDEPLHTGHLSSTHMTKTPFTSSTHKHLHTSVQSSTEHKITFKETDATQLSNTETTIEKETIKTVIKATTHLNTMASALDCEITRRSDDTNRGMVFGILIGLGIALIFGSLLILLRIYIMRRYCMMSNETKSQRSKDVQARNNQSCQNIEYDDPTRHYTDLVRNSQDDSVTYEVIQKEGVNSPLHS